MGILADLAGLRPMMPFAQLSQLIGPEWQPSPAGWLSEKVRFAARIDVEGRIGTLVFEENFPSTLSMEGLHVGMHLDDVLASGHGFSIALPRSYPFKFTDYTGRTDAGDDVTARVAGNGIVRSLQFSRPGTTYRDGERRFATHININPCCYSDPTEMLFDWAYGHSHTEDHDTFPPFAKWLVEQSTPDEWHCFVPNWNWDFGIEPLLWIVQQERCDLATALTAFYWTHPGQLLEERAKISQYQLDYFDLVHEIRRRFLDGFYKNSTLAFDGARVFADQAYFDSDADDDAIKRAIPEAMRAVIPGRVLQKARAIDAWDFKPLHPRRPSTIVPPALTDEELGEVEQFKQRVAAMQKSSLTKS
jgi:hypothetical protein